MSFGISAIILEPKEGEDKVPFLFMGGFDGLNWHMAKDEPRKIQRLNSSIKTILPKEYDGITTLELLRTAPMDEVIVITGESSYAAMGGRQPLNCAKGSGNEHIWADVKGYLEGKYTK